MVNICAADAVCGVISWMDVPRIELIAPKVRRVELFTEEDGREVVVLRTGRWRHLGIPVDELSDGALRARLAALAASLPAGRVDERSRDRLAEAG